MRHKNCMLVIIRAYIHKKLSSHGSLFFYPNFWELRTLSCACAIWLSTAHRGSPYTTKLNHISHNTTISIPPSANCCCCSTCWYSNEDIWFLLECSFQAINYLQKLSLAITFQRINHSMGRKRELKRDHLPEPQTVFFGSLSVTICNGYLAKLIYEQD